MRIARVQSAARAALVVVCAMAAVPASAQELIPLPETGLSPAPLWLTIDEAQPAALLPARASDEPRRPAALLPLYASFVALQGLDVHSTRTALESGAGREGNPAMRPFAGNSAAFIGVKAGATAGVIWASEKMWKKNRKAAIVFTTLVNTAMAAIVAHNYRVSR